ncbi:MAG TPA: hydroxymethylbilane synthase [Pseudonocardiaceae bacterium]|nr:hydroxymethylbilane synthase [Pseudonocardiaceae bacterium]
MDTVIVGARGSKLAQAMVSELLQRLGGEQACPVVKIKRRVVLTDGDKDRKTVLREVSGGAGAFAKQLEAELLAGNIDIAVHCLKDLPTELPEGLTLSVTPTRADIRDALCGSSLAGMRPGARVGTGSPRRIAQLLALRPDIEVVPIRGNVPGRLAKLKSGFDAVVLGVSGLVRIGMDDAITEILDPEVFLPSPSAGAMGVEVRARDTELLAMLDSYGNPALDAQVRAERALLNALHGGCSVPVGAYAQPTVGDNIELVAQVTSLDGTRKVIDRATGDSGDPEALGRMLAERMLAAGAAAILDDIRVVV